MRDKRILIPVMCCLAGLVVLATGCLDISPVTELPPASENVPATVTVEEEASDDFGGWLGVYFTDPDNPLAAQYSGGPDETLAMAIGAARVSVDVAAYNLTLWSIRDALLAAHERGVVVRVVAESDNLDGEEYQQLAEAGIAVLGDRREGLMHNKFVIIDRSEVWTGSMNFTVGGTYYDYNNLIHLREIRIAENYLVEFEEMFTEDVFGPDDLALTPHPVVTVDGTQVEVYFSPDDGVEARLLELVAGAEENIYFMAYSFTSNPLGEAIRQKAAEGVTVVGIMESEQANTNSGSEYEIFIQNGLDVVLDGRDGLMHHKVIIIDGQIVVTGSYNFSANAEERNDENVVIIHNARVAALFLDEYQRLRDLVTP